MANKIQIILESILKGSGLKDARKDLKSTGDEAKKAEDKFHDLGDGLQGTKGDVQAMARAMLKGSDAATEAASKLAKKYELIEKRAKSLAITTAARGDIKKASAMTDRAKAAGKLAAQYKKIGTEAQKTKKKVNPMSKAIKAVAWAVIARAVGKAGVELFKLGENAQRAQQAIIGYAGSAAEAEEITRAVQKAAGGAVSKMEAMQNASKLLAMGLATDADEAAKLTKIAITLGASMGKGPTQAFEDFTLLLANQSIPRLDTFGISAGKTRTRINELMAANKDLTRETAFMQAVMEGAEVKMVALEAAGFDATGTTDKLSTAFADLKLALAEATLEMAGPAAAATAKSISARLELTDAIKRGIITEDDLKDARVKGSRGAMDLAAALEILAAAEEKIVARTEELANTPLSMETFAAEARKAAGAGEDFEAFAAGLKHSALAILELSTATIGRKQLEFLDKAAGLAVTDTDIAKIRELREQTMRYMGISEEDIELTFAIGAIEAGFVDLENTGALTFDAIIQGYADAGAAGETFKKLIPTDILTTVHIALDDPNGLIGLGSTASQRAANATSSADADIVRRGATARSGDQPVTVNIENMNGDTRSAREIADEIRNIRR